MSSAASTSLPPLQIFPHYSFTALESSWQSRYGADAYQHVTQQKKPKKSGVTANDVNGDSVYHTLPSPSSIPPSSDAKKHINRSVASSPANQSRKRTNA